MTNASWQIAELAAQLLEPAEREAVLGDLVEAGVTGWNAVADVLGLVFRRQALLLRSSQPWFVTVAVAWPACYLLMGVSASVSCTYERLFKPGVTASYWWPTGHEGVLLLSCHILLLGAWSWVIGYLCGSESRRSLLFLMGFAMAPSFFRDFDIAPLPKGCLLLFLLPLALGILHGLRGLRVGPLAALILATAITGLMVFCWNNEALWILNWTLLFPGWYLVALAFRPLRSVSATDSSLAS